MLTALTIAGLLIAGMGLYAMAAVAAVHGGASPWLLIAGMPALYLALFVLVSALWFLLSWIHRSPRPPEVRLGAAAVWRLFWGEVFTIGGSPWRMGIGWWFMRDPAPARATAPVLLLHGVLGNSGVWLGTRRRLANGHSQPLYTLSYGPPLASMDRFVEQTAARIEAILAATGARDVILVGHSLGGLVARAYVQRHGGAQVRRIVTIGTPHAGSAVARLFPGTTLSQLRPGSAWLRSIGTAADSTVAIVSVWSWHDSMIAPQRSACLSGARNIAIAGVGHNALLRDARVLAMVAAEIGAAAEYEAESGAPSIAGSVSRLP